MSARTHEPPVARIEIIEPEDCDEGALPPEGNVKLRNYRLLAENVRAYTPTGDVHTSPAKRKLVPRYDVCAALSPPRERLLQLLRPGEPHVAALEAIVRPAPRRALQRPLDEDSHRFLQRALLSPSPQGLSAGNTPEPRHASHRHERDREPPASPTRSISPPEKDRGCGERSLAEELREAEDRERRGGESRRELLREYHFSGASEAAERERLGRLALSVEGEEVSSLESSDSLWAAAQRLDALLEESRALHEELAQIHDDLQVLAGRLSDPDRYRRIRHGYCRALLWGSVIGIQSARAGRCTAAVRALDAEASALQYLDDVVALLRGDVAAAGRARSWPFALGGRQPGRNYVV